MAEAPSDAPPPPGAKPDAIMHAALTSHDGLLIAADDPSGSFDGTVHGMCVNCSVPDGGDAKRIFDALAPAGAAQVPLGEAFFPPAFGLCTDRIVVPWMSMV